MVFDAHHLPMFYGVLVKMVDSFKRMRFSEFLNSLCKQSPTLDAVYGEPILAVDDKNGAGYYDSASGFERVGMGKVTATTCGQHFRWLGCSKELLHNKIVDGVNYAGKAFMTNVVYSCGKPSCPNCFLLGWAARSAWKIEGRLEAVSAKLKEISPKSCEIEHIICSVPPKDYGITDYDVIKARARKALRLRGVIGGNMIFHAFRKNRFGVHFHILGFIRGGYGCRDCKKVGACMKCDGFEGKVRRLRLKDGYVVKISVDKDTGVAEKRKTIGGTVWYQLSHASIKRGVARFHVSSYFGVASPRKMKVLVPFRRRICPVCESDLVRHIYVGLRPSSDLCKRKPKSGICRRGSVEDIYENGERVWVEVESLARREGGS